MFDIKLAEEDDFEDVLALCRKFYTDTPYAKMIPFDEDSAVAHIWKIYDNGFVLLAKDGEEAVGLIGCLISPFHANAQFTMCNECFWFVDEKHRKGSLGLRLMKEAERLAVHDGCTMMVMSSLSNSPKGLDNVLKKLGYVAQESSYVKGI